MPEQDNNNDHPFDLKLSAAIDAEANEEELQEVVDGVIADPEKKKDWERLHLINAVVRSGSAPKLFLRDGIDWDDPLKDARDRDQGNKNTVNIGTLLDTVRNRFSWAWAGGAALAMSVLLAVSMFVTIQPELTGGSDDQIAEQTQDHSNLPSIEENAVQLADSDEQVLRDEEEPLPPVSSQQPEPVLVKTDSPQQTAKPPARGMPPQPNRQPNDLVRLVRD